MLRRWRGGESCGLAVSHCFLLGLTLGLVALRSPGWNPSSASLES